MLFCCEIKNIIPWLISWADKFERTTISVFSEFPLATAYQTSITTQALSIATVLGVYAALVYSDELSLISLKDCLRE
jgi:hypothetical protein